MQTTIIHRTPLIYYRKTWIQLCFGFRKVVGNDYLHGALSAFGRIALEQGYHPYKLLYEITI
ncbi:MAG: hypothetical protein ACLUER_02665 [Odoribacter splanchnicus]